MYQNIMRRKSWISILLLSTLLSCTEVRLIGAYNQNVDLAIQNISKDIATLFVLIESNVDDEKDYSYNNLRGSYINIEGEIQSCITVANGLQKYNIIVKQLVQLDSALSRLKEDHISGFVAPGVKDKAVIKRAVELDRSAFTIALSAMLDLQEGLKREKSTSK